MQVVAAIATKLHELAARRRPVHRIAGLVKRETIMHRVVVHALDARHRAAQRLRGQNARSSSDNEEGEEGRRKTETSHGNIYTTQCRQRKQFSLGHCARVTSCPIAERSENTPNRERRLSN